MVSSPLLDMLKALAAGEQVSERDFDLIFPKDARKLSRTHWTPLAAAIRAAQLLVDRPGVRVLDVGSGSGKFCLVGALTTTGSFTGIEQDEELVGVAKDLVRTYGVARVKFVTGDALRSDWLPYDAVYLFNPFANHVANEADYMDIIGRVSDKLADLRRKTRVVTYHGFGGQMPAGYVQEVAETVGPGVLQLWVKR